ncbi:MAG: hypothetical protein NTX05_08090 [Fusobacteria bacterium]|nr:hypothetical protein [Fusobacteriota bacterium]
MDNNRESDFILLNRGDDLSLKYRESADCVLKIPFEFPMLNTKYSIAVVIHIFYVDLIVEIQDYLNNILFDFDIYISTDTLQKKIYIENQFMKFNKRVEVRVFPNRGRDIAPFVVGFRDVIEQYKYILHIHTKKSLTHPQASEWRKYLFDRLLGSPEIIRSIFLLLEHKEIGMVFPDHYPFLKPFISWGGNYDLSKEELKRVNFNLSLSNRVEFPSGSMFWAKTEALKELFKQNYEWDSFPGEQGQINGTLAHSIERTFLYYVELSQRKWIKVDIDCGRVVNSIEDCSEIIQGLPSILSYHPEQFEKLVNDLCIKQSNRLINLMQEVEIISNERDYNKEIIENIYNSKSWKLSQFMLNVAKKLRVVE